MIYSAELMTQWKVFPSGQHPACHMVRRYSRLCLTAMVKNDYSWLFRIRYFIVPQWNLSISLSTFSSLERLSIVEHERSSSFLAQPDLKRCFELKSYDCSLLHQKKKKEKKMEMVALQLTIFHFCVWYLTIYKAEVTANRTWEHILTSLLYRKTSLCARLNLWSSFFVFISGLQIVLLAWVELHFA